MDIPRLVAEYRELPEVSQIETLLRLAHELTVVGRDAYDGPTRTARHAGRLCCLNEVQHLVSRQVLALLNTGPRRCADEVVTAAILNQDDPQLRQQIAAAFARSLAPAAS
jgi:hypothetical protein